jgi:hypothetical protein
MSPDIQYPEIIDNGETKASSFIIDIEKSQDTTEIKPLMTHFSEVDSEPPRKTRRSSIAFAVRLPEEVELKVSENLPEEHTSKSSKDDEGLEGEDLKDGNLEDEDVEETAKEQNGLLVDGNGKKHGHSKMSLASSTGEGGRGKELNENIAIKLQHSMWIFVALVLNILLAEVLSELQSKKGFAVSFLSNVLYVAAADVLQMYMFLCHGMTVLGKLYITI